MTLENFDSHIFTQRALKKRKLWLKFLNSWKFGKLFESSNRSGINAIPQLQLVWFTQSNQPFQWYLAIAGCGCSPISWDQWNNTGNAIPLLLWWNHQKTSSELLPMRPQSRNISAFLSRSSAKLSKTENIGSTHWHLSLLQILSNIDGLMLLHTRNGASVASLASEVWFSIGVCLKIGYWIHWSSTCFNHLLVNLSFAWC